MNQEQVTSIIRQLLLTIGGGLVTKGYLDDGTLQLVIGAIMAVGAAAWALYTRRNAGLIESAAGVPKVHKIVTDPTTAAAIPSAKVVGPNGD
jgi:hypothetical protein